MDSEKKRDFVDKFFNSNIFDGESGELKKKYYEKLLNAFQKEIKIESLFRYKSFIKDYDFDEEVEYTIVGSAEADPMNFRISNESPVGKGLIGKKVGDVVEVNVPDGVSKFEVLDIRRA